VAELVHLSGIVVSTSGHPTSPRPHAEDQSKANGEEPAEEAKPFIEARVQLVLAIALEIGFNSRSSVKRG
jgi:hypothetical protein